MQWYNLTQVYIYAQFCLCFFFKFFFTILASPLQVFSFTFFFAFFFLTFYLNLASSNQDNPSNKRPCIRFQNGAPKASVDLIARLAAAADKPCSDGKWTIKTINKVENCQILRPHFVEVTKYCSLNFDACLRLLKSFNLLLFCFCWFIVWKKLTKSFTSVQVNIWSVVRRWLSISKHLKVSLSL